MGLDMNTQNKKCAYFILFAATLALAGCLKKQDLDDQNLGPALDPAEAQKQFKNALGENEEADSTSGLYLNQMASIQTSVTFEDSQSFTIANESVTIKGGREEGEKFIVDILHSYESRQSPGCSFSKISKSIDFFSLNFGSSESSCYDGVTILPMRFMGLYSRICEFAGIKCYNFSVTPVILQVNPLLFDTEICPKHDSCELNAKKIEFDILDSNNPTNAGRPSRQHFSITLVPKIAWMARVFQICSRRLQTWGNRKVLIEQCDTLTSANTGDKKKL
jgi:hypothetical protein